MPYQKLKSENYQNFGGINSKYSQYNTGPMEFLDLINLDFQTPGALTARWGSTMYVGQTFPGPIKSLFEFSRLDGSSYLLISHSGGIFSGATTGNSQGISFTLQSATFSSFYYISRPGHGIAPNFIPFEGGQDLAVPYLGNPDVYAGSSLFFVDPIVQSENVLSYTVLNNFLFLADGAKFSKFDGVTTFPVGLPPPSRPFGQTTGVGGASIYYSALSGSSDFIGMGLTGSYITYLSYVNNRGYEGPLWPMQYFNGVSFMDGGSLAGLAGTFLAYRMPVATPLQYGISAVNQYIYFSPTTIVTASNDTTFWGGRGGLMSLVSSTPASGSTITYVLLGSTSGGQSMIMANAGKLPDTPNRITLGTTIISNFDLPYQASSEVNLVPFFPRFLETYQNRLFLSGFSTTPSTVWFSEIAEPEGFDPDANFEVRTNDGDVITAIKSYTSRFYIFKKSSFHVLSGDNPQNFLVQQVTDQYGCMNSRCAVVYDDLLVFLDRKGMVLWNGSNLQVLSDKIQPTFDAMNFSAALTSACMVHDKLRNQILCAIPVNGSTTNNVTVVYDYLAGALTKYDGVNPSVFAAVQGRNNTRNAFYGDQNGRVNWFGSSFLSDNGVGFTTYMKTRFLHDQGQSVQKMFRRLFINADSPASSTLVFGVNFFQDYGASVVLGTTMVLSQFQNRIDYGVSAKSLAFEMSNIQSNMRLRIQGFTIESRYLRSV